MTALATLRTSDPAELGYPPTLPVEIALRTAPLPRIFKSYGLGKEDYARLREDPVFKAHLARCVEAVRKDGMSFKMKAQLQSEELLKTSWRLIHSSHDAVAPSVKADLIKFTVRAAGLDGSKDQAAAAQNANALQININLG